MTTCRKPPKICFQAPTWQGQYSDTEYWLSKLAQRPNVSVGPWSNSSSLQSSVKMKGYLSR
jgi:hypothetical protein